MATSGTKVTKKIALDGDVNFNIYITKFTKSMYPGYSFSTPAKGSMNAFLNIMGREIADTAVDVCRSSKKRTVSVDHIEAARKLVFPQLNIGYQAMKAVNKYNSSKKGKCSKTKVTKEERAGLIFPPSRALRFIKDPKKVISVHDVNVSETASVYLASILELLFEDFLGIIKYTKMKGTRFSIGDIKRAADNGDDSFCDLISRYSIILSGGGVTPVSKRMK